MTARLSHGDDFTALTVTDSAGATLTVERTDAGHLSAWIAPPGGSDGHSVVIGEADAICLSAYLTGRDDLASRLEAYQAMCDELRERNEKLTALANAAAEWRAQFSKPDLIKFPRRAALIAAVDALPNMQEPCGICSGFGCPDCRNDLSGVAR